jgi:DNA polymerase III sliding clamp (beta) subunit (PCNA family)
MTVQEFRSLLALAEKGVTRRSTQPVQNNVLVERDAGDRVRLSATDLEFVDVSTWQEGFDEGAVVYRITLPPKALKGALKGKAPKTEVTFRPVTKTEVDLHLNGSVSRLRGMAAEDFEAIPAVEKGFAARLSREDLSTLEHVAKACSTDETRPTLLGVLLRLGAGTDSPEVVATDTHRLAKATLRTKPLGAHRGETDHIIMRRALSVLFAAAQKEDVVTGAFGDTVTEFRGETWRLRTRSVEGCFPDYTRVIPDARKHLAGFRADVEALRSALGAVASVASEDGDRVAFVPTGEGLTLYAESAEVGKAQADLPAEVNGNGKTWPIGLNAAYLADALPERGQVTVTWSSVLEPVVVTAPDAPLSVVMPMVLDDTVKAAVTAMKRRAKEATPTKVDAEPEPAEASEPEVKVTCRVEPARREPLPADTFTREPEPARCSVCGTLAEPEGRYCTQCGVPLRSGREAAPVAPEPAKCAVCNGTGEVYGGWERAEPCPSCTTPNAQPAPCEVGESRGELATRTGQVRPYPVCRSTTTSSPAAEEVPATSAPEAPVPHLSFADKDSRKEEVKRALADFCDTIAAGVGDDTFDAFLSYAARFHRYSWRNTLLIMFQRPEAYFVAGYHRWRDLGRSVKRGAKAIWILAPARYHKTVAKDDGDTEEVEALYFRPVPVFADVDTEGDGPIPNFRPDLPEADALLPALHEVAASWGVPVLRVQCEGNGWSDGTRVNINPNLSEGIAAQTLIHELSHHLLRHRDLSEKHAWDRRLFEGEAEGVKVVVLRYFGVDTTGNGAAYLRAHGATAEVVRRSAHRIMQTAKQVIEALEEALAEPEAQPVAAG